ncbi:hypothetical protein AB4097_03485 [Microvirga sp. 2MCAF35]|uniref:hypothetical protein n=1 Tax=Microvirga sp. 2MCAF35 TaxID=3232987 RepID=UPI003F9664E1
MNDGAQSPDETILEEGESPEAEDIGLPQGAGDPTQLISMRVASAVRFCGPFFLARSRTLRGGAWRNYIYMTLRNNVYVRHNCRIIVVIFHTSDILLTGVVKK